MLKLVLGRAGSGKTEYLRSILRKRAEDGEDRLLLIVPEQFSYSCERAFLETMKAGTAQKIEVLSFTRLADFAARKTGGLRGTVLDDADKIILMLHTLNDIRDGLCFYELQAEKTHFAKDLIILISEFRKQNITAKNLALAAFGTENRTLKGKLLDLSLILERFDAALSENGFTDEDLLTNQLIDVLHQNRIFEGYTVCIDAFKGFTGQEFLLIRELERQSRETYVSLCIDPEVLEEDDPSMIFSAVKQTVLTLKSTTGKEPEIIPLTGSRFQSEELKFLERNLFSSHAEKYPEKPENITLFRADTKSDECAFIAASIRKLLREEGMRLRDIAVLARREEKYRNDLTTALLRYGVPVFEDTRQPVENQPVITLCKALLNILMSRELKTADILTFLKTGFSPLSETEVSELENYVFVWNIKGPEWLNPFTGDPAGITAKKDEEKISSLNACREAIVEVLDEFRSGIDVSKGRKSLVKPAETAEKLYSFLSRDFVRTKLRNHAEQLDRLGSSALAAEQNRIWELLMDLLNKLAVLNGENEITLEMFSELFSAGCGMMTLGSLPHGLDELTIGSADRSRLDNPSVVFVCGCIEGEFPQNITSKVLLTSGDRKILSEKLGIDISPGNELAAGDERFIAYSAVTSPCQKLFVSCHTKTGADEALSPSPLYTDIYERFEKAELTSESTGPCFYAETEESAFSAYASGYPVQSPGNADEYATIKAALADSGNYREKFLALDSMMHRREQKLSRETAKALFGSNIYTSASRTETFFSCPFQYFCRYGLGISPRRRVELSSQIRGSAVHYVLEQILREHSKEEFEALGNQEQQQLIAHYLGDFLTENNIASVTKDARFSYKYRQLTRVLTDVIARMVEEFKVSDFIPVAFEYAIKADIPLPDGSRLGFSGSIDRVDLFENPDGKKYLRVVDYKTYGKEFSLNHVLAGLDMQMLIYLFTAKNTGFKGSEPAGILYYNASDASLSSADRAMTTESRLETIIKNKAGSGLWLADEEVLSAMEKGRAGRFYDPKKLQNSLVSLKQMGRIEELVNTNLAKMAEELKSGNIDLHPVYDGGDTVKGCTYCDYSGICGFEGQDSLCNDITNLNIEDYFKNGDGDRNA